MPLKKRHRKKIRYKEISIKLSLRQSKSLKNYCEARKTTPTKLIKKSIRKYIEFYDKTVPEQYFVTETQLQLFCEEEPN